MGVLDGMLVLDFGRYIAGPFCASLLGDLGAEVIRIDNVEGGGDRNLMPATERGDGALFLQTNHGKKSVTLNMACERGRLVARRLIAQSDIVVANFPPRVLRRLGLDYSSVRALKEDIILTTATAFGTDGPLADGIGFDGIGQAISGAIYLTGEPGKPYRAAVSYVDYATAIACAYGTLAAVIARMKTGKGSHVDGSLVATAMTMTNPMLIEEATGMRSRVATANRSPIAGPSDIFETSDGRIIMQVIGQEMFARWVRLVGEEQLLDDPRFADDMKRGDNGEVLSAVMARWCRDRTSDECLAALNRARIVAGPVLSPRQVLEPERLLAETYFDWIELPGSNRHIPIAKPSARLSMSDPPHRCVAPELGAHTDGVLARFGFTGEEIAALRADGIV